MCYLPYCKIVGWLTCNIFIKQKLPYLRGLLVCAVLMLITNLVYIIIYIVVSIRLCIKGNADMKEVRATFQKQSASVDFEYQRHYPPKPMNYHSQIDERPYPGYPMDDRYQPHSGYPMNDGYRPHPAYPMNDGYRQPSPKKLMSKREPFEQDDLDDGYRQPSPRKSKPKREPFQQDDLDDQYRQPSPKKSKPKREPFQQDDLEDGRF